ncbi:MAG: beta-propeller domain-containing protein, partial [Mogibacterium sp.]|nr:beta-propeller domain-containing protein [Mogibacterium sp.]
DPLFILDLSDPADPVIEGEVKIKGFSSLLVPVDEKTMLGIGYATRRTEWGGVAADGVKLALFDISDPADPKVLDSRAFRNLSSEAQYDHHALLVHPDYYAIPYSRWEEELVEDDVIIEDSEVAEEDSAPEAQAGEEEDDVSDVYDEEVPFRETGSSGGVLTFTAKKNIEITNNFEIPEDGVSRCVYIGNYIYLLDYFDEIHGFEVK